MKVHMRDKVTLAMKVGFRYGEKSVMSKVIVGGSRRK